MLDQFESQSKKTKEHFVEELKSIRTGRAHPAMLANIQVAAYGSMMPLNQLANVSAPEPKLLLVEAWDKAVLKEIEKAVSLSALGLSPVSDGNVLRLRLPELTEETRRNLIKVISEKLEHSRIALRQARDEAKKNIESLSRGGDLTEDDRYDLVEKLDKKIKEATTELETLAKDKEREVMTI